MINRKVAAAVLCISVLFAGCTATVDESTSSSESEDKVTETTDATTESTLPPYMQHDYVPEGDGYFSLIEEGYGTKIKSQVAGTCWAYAGTTAIESNYKVRTGEDILLDPIWIVSDVYGSDKEEGFFLNNGISRLSAGGWGIQTVGALADGCEGYYLYDASMFDSTDTEGLKNAVRTYGGLLIAICDNSSATNYIDNYITVNVPGSVDDPDYEFDHAVVLVGWDDNFPADYFKTPASQNGAWLAQNSMGGQGLYWVSYDSPLAEVLSLSVTTEYSGVSSYDCFCGDMVTAGDTTEIANVFHQPGTLAAVGFYTVEDGQTITVEVRDGEFGDVLATVTGTFDLNGYHSIVLPSAIEVTDYTLVASYDGPAPVEGVSGYEDFVTTLILTSHEGESFVKIDGQWHDLSLQETADLLSAEGILNNCCLKGLYI